MMDGSTTWEIHTKCSGTTVGDRRGFTIFDTETLEHFHVDNPYRLFYNIYYEDTPHQLFDASEYEEQDCKSDCSQENGYKKL